jgi:menaquinone-specific isochorismate synthase
VSLAPAVTPTLVRSIPIADPGPLLSRLPRASADAALCWLRGGDGLVAWGEAARLCVRGPDRFAAAARWWDETVNAINVDDLVGVPGSGPVAFGSFTFADGPADSVMVLPRVVIGRRAGAAWVTAVDADPESVIEATTDLEPLAPIGEVRYADGSRPVHEWESAVTAAVLRIRAGELDKVVLARDLLAMTDAPVDVRALLHRLTARYPGCWTFAVDGLLGSTPELLLRRTGDHVESRVLAGTIDRGADAVTDAEHAAELLGSAKDRSEHELAVRSVAEALAPYCSDLVVPRRPEIVRLANVQHLATDVTGRLGNGETALDLAAALHPTAAVCGTPTNAARTVIEQLEGMDRRRYAGPVGWVDARGDGAFGIALRCAEVESNSRLRLFAGCGIVAGSEPAAELAESQAKLLAMRDALEGP